MTTEDTNVETATEAPKKKKTSKKTAKKKAAPKKVNGGGRKAKYQENARITLLVKENPRRKGTEAYARFSALMGSKTVGEFLKKAERHEDWDARGTLAASVKRKQIKIS